MSLPHARDEAAEGVAAQPALAVIDALDHVLLLEAAVVYGRVA